MKRLTCLLLIALTSTVIFVGSPSDVSAQPGIYVSQEARRAATDVVNGRVVSTTSVMVNGEAHRVSEVEVSANDSGQVSGTILVEVPGGERPDGTTVYVSHTPELVAGALVQLAVSPAEPTVAAVAPVATRRQLPVYSVVRGSAGAYALTADGVGSGAAVGDYTLTGPSWPDFAPPVGFWVNPSNSGLGEADAIEGVRRAFDLWQDDLGSDIEFEYRGQTNKSGVNLGDEQTVVSWVSSSAGWLAQASWIANSKGSIISFDVQINTAYSWSNGPASGRFDIGTVVGHEVGHGIGFGHPPASSELMYFQIMSGAMKGLGPGDRSGAAHLYPSETPICNGKLVTVDLNSGEGRPTEGPDVIFGTPGPDEIHGLGGDDTICSGGGADIVYGGAGDDFIDGGGGGDKLFGGPGDDRILGGWGNDTIHGNRGRDALSGDDGNDKIYGYADDDWIWGGNGNDILHGNRGTDHVFGGAGEDKLWGYSEDDELDGGDGDDLVVGNFGDDTLDGGSGADILIGSDGSDMLRGGSGNDELHGNSGDDHLDGGSGNDTLDGGINFDICDGSTDFDSASRCETEISVP